MKAQVVFIQPTGRSEIMNEQSKRRNLSGRNPETLIEVIVVIVFLLFLVGAFFYTSYVVRNVEEFTMFVKVLIVSLGILIYLFTWAIAFAVSLFTSYVVSSIRDGSFEAKLSVYLGCCSVVFVIIAVAINMAFVRWIA
jgi:CBS domain containing-hemolysin-like protein